MRLLLTSLFCCVSVFTADAADAPVQNVVFATVDSHKLRLNIFLPRNVKRPPLVVYIHGGGWEKGSYKSCKVQWLTEHGFAVASVGYRLTDKAKFPAQIHDCKGAIRWLRAHQTEYGYDTTRIGVTGTSAGGYLSLMVGVTNGVKEMEGDVGGNTDQSSRVDVIVDYYGPADFVLRSRNQPIKTEGPTSIVHKLLGAPASKNKELATAASPAFQVKKDAPPLLILHGKKDGTVFPDQAERMAVEYRKAGRDVTLELIPRGGHGGKAFFTKPYRKKVVDFFKKHLPTARSPASSAMSARPLP